MRFVSSLILLLVLSQSTRAQDFRVGQKVLPKAPDVTTSVNGEELDLFPQLPGTVIEVKGDRLAIRSGGLHSQVLKTQVVPLEQAVDHFTTLLSETPRGTWALTLRGTAHQLNGDVDLAIEDFNEVIRRQPTVAEGYYNRGNAYSSAAEFDKAIGDYTMAIQLDPKYAPAYVSRASAWLRMEKHDIAIADYTAAIQLHPQDPVAYSNRGLAWIRKQEHDKAVADYTEAIRVDPTHVPAYLNRGNAWLDKKEYAKAQADYDEALRLQPENAEVHNAQAWLSRQLWEQEIDWKTWILSGLFAALLVGLACLFWRRFSRPAW